jgi:hypothetical protein
MTFVCSVHQVLSEKELSREEIENQPEESELRFFDERTYERT